MQVKLISHLRCEVAVIDSWSKQMENSNGFPAAPNQLIKFLFLHWQRNQSQRMAIYLLLYFSEWKFHEHLAVGCCNGSTFCSWREPLLSGLIAYSKVNTIGIAFSYYHFSWNTEGKSIQINWLKMTQKCWKREKPKWECTICSADWNFPEESFLLKIFVSSHSFHLEKEPESNENATKFSRRSDAGHTKGTPKKGENETP